MEHTVLVTGGSGMLGTAVLRHLQQYSWAKEVVAPRSSEFDLRQQEEVAIMYEKYSPSLVIHCAGRVGGIGDAREHPAEFFYENTMMGVHVLHEAYAHNVQKFVGIGSVCAYPEWAEIPLKEADLWSGYPEPVNAPYGIAKKAMLVQGQSYRKQYNFNAIHLLLVNLYGPGDTFDLEKSHVIAAMIRRCIEAKERGEKEVVLWGDGSPTREFLFVDDAANAICLAAEQYNGSEPINVGSGQEISIKNLADVIAKTVGYEGAIVWDTTKPNGQPRRCLDVSKAKKEFDFVAQTPFEVGLRKTVEYFEAVRNEQENA